MSRIIELAQEIDREFEEQRVMVCDLKGELEQEKERRKKLINALQALLEEYKI